MRAAFRAAMDGKQVAVLVPTTILAQQHHQTFVRRFTGYPIAVESLSRFKSRADQSALVRDLREGKVDIVIGTHRLLQDDVAFRDLGLLVIDEEHRFGVKHKEKLRDYRKLVDVISLTATPIPRTLHMALVGIRDLSLINTPPEDRHAIRTRVMEYGEDTIREAILREMSRGGQVFFVHNRVRTINAVHDSLRRIVPEARVVTAHGQMDEKQLSRVMNDFIEKRADVLLCTSIIESGLDIPSANTIVIDRADQFGLAELYQLRGRVGRSDQRAFAYLLIPSEALVAGDARKRLAALQELSDLGSGFRLATHDLEIRGTGDLLGARQSGHIAAIGYEMYTDMMEQAVRELKGERVSPDVEPEINLKVPAFVPDDYVSDTGERLVLYRRLARARTENEVADIAHETADRYGRIPEPLEHLLEVIRIKVLMKG
ncbi:MAG: helicase-related protein, partial [Vicinamibacteria bacterium]